jgi:hypothetical protein
LPVCIRICSTQVYSGKRFLVVDEFSDFRSAVKANALRDLGCYE